IVCAIRAAQERGGYDSVGVFGGGGLTNETAYLLGKFARVALHTRNIDYNGRFCMSSAAAAGIEAFGVDRGLPFPLEDIPGAAAILLIGSNVVETMPPVMQYFDKERLVVIGNGMAGARVVEEIWARGGGEQFTITMFGAEPYGNYNRIMLSDVLNGKQSPEQLVLNPLDWYAEHEITLHLGAAVVEIDRAPRQVVTQQDLRVPYDILIIATGSHSFVPPMDNLYGSDGQLKQGAFVFRTLDDCQKIASYAQHSRRAAVIGGGLLGLEAARGLLTYGCEVHVIQRG